jgi:hypothetical protein
MRGSSQCRRVRSHIFTTWHLLLPLQCCSRPSTRKPRILVLDPSKTIRSFTVALNSPMGLKSGRGQGTFIDGLLTSVDTFYTEVLQGLKAW